MPRNLNDSTAVTVLFMMVSGRRAGGLAPLARLIDKHRLEVNFGPGVCAR